MGIILGSRCVMAHKAHACVLAVACACGPSRAWRRVSQRADPEPPADSSRASVALLFLRATGATCADAVGGSK